MVKTISKPDLHESVDIRSYE